MQKTGGNDDRSPLAIGYAWSVVISGIAFGMVIPALIGVWIDQKCGTLVLFTLLGAVLGMTVALMQLICLGKQTSKNTDKKAKT